MDDVIVAKLEPEYRAIHRAADRLAPQIKRQFLEAVARATGRLRARLDELERLLAAGRVDAVQVMGIFRDIQLELDPRLSTGLQDIIRDAGGSALSQLDPALRQTFTLTNLRATEAVNTVVRDSLTQILGDSAEAVVAVIREGFQHGYPPRDMAKRIVDGRLIGLNARYAIAVENLRAAQLDAGIDPPTADRRAAAYANRLLRLRATSIARTETIRAANVGQQEAWQQAQERGLLQREGTHRIWIVTPDDRLCPICEGIPDQHPHGVGLDERFDSEVGPLLTPPAHPSCRCAIGLVVAQEE